MRIWRCVLLFTFVLIGAAGWGLSPAAREKILQLKEKYRHDAGTVGTTGFRDLARDLRLKLQKEAEEKARAEAAEKVAAAPVPTAAKIPAAQPAGAAVIAAEAENRIPASQPEMLAESFDQTTSAPRPETAPGNVAVSTAGGGRQNSDGSFGEFVLVMLGLVVLLSLSGHLAGPLLGSMGPGGGMKNIFAAVVGGGLVLGIMVLLNEIWQKHLPIVAVLFFCMICPKGLDQAFSSGVGCLAMLAALVFLAPLMLAGNFMLYVVFAFLALFAMRR